MFLHSAFQLERKYNTLFGGDNKAGLWFATGVGQPVPASTTVKNLVSSSFFGTINGATFNSAGYFEFGSSNVEIDIGNDILDTENFGTVEAWINTAQFGRRAIFSSASTTNINRWFRFAVNTVIYEYDCTCESTV